MMVVLALKVELIKGTEQQLFQNLFDMLHQQETFSRDQNGDVFLQYSTDVDTVVISKASGALVKFPEEARPWPTEG